jgi:hypothetical protein
MMTMGKSLVVASIGIGALLGGGTSGCGSSKPPAATATDKNPSTMDSDDDGIFDDVDLCPNEKEDGKGANDKDGCPEGKGKS